MASGITATLLHVDLTSRTTRIDEVREVTIRVYRGEGEAAHTFLREPGSAVKA